MSEVRSSELETGLSSSDDPVEVNEDTTASSPWEIKASHALGRCVTWTLRRSLGLGIGSNSLRGLGFVFLIGRNELVTFRLGKCASTRLLSCAGLDSPSTPSSWSF